MIASSSGFSSCTREVFVSVLGQHDNLGDTVLRRQYLDALRPAGKLVICTGTRDSGYISGLGIKPEDELVSSDQLWRRRLIKAAVTEGAILAFNTGELAIERSQILSQFKNVPILEANRRNGGRAVHVGLGLRTLDGRARKLKAYLRRFDLVSWRDAMSAASAGIGMTFPDWAFAHSSQGASSTENSARRLLAVSLRYDRLPPNSAWLRCVRAVATELNLEIVAVPQVGRDTARAIELARIFDCKVVEWDGVDHASHERRVREIYSQAAAVMSDRLHALVIGATEGAVPIGVPTDESTAFKIGRTMDTAGFCGSTYTFHGESSPPIPEVLERITSRRSFEARLASAQAGTSELIAKLRSEICDEGVSE